MVELTNEKNEINREEMRDALSGMFDDFAKAINQIKFISYSLENELDLDLVAEQNIEDVVYSILDCLCSDFQACYEYYEPMFSKI